MGYDEFPIFIHVTPTGQEVIMMKKYLVCGKTYSGKEIDAAKIGKTFIRIMRGNEKAIVKVSLININPNRFYHITDAGNIVKIYPDRTTSWSCTTEEYNDIMKKGSEVVDKLFGDLI